MIGPSQQPPDPVERAPADSFDTCEWEVVDASEIVDADRLAVVAVSRGAPPARPVALAQTAAVAATGFVAGVATAAVLGRRRRQRRLGRARNPAGAFELVSSRTYLVDVHVLERRV